MINTYNLTVTTTNANVADLVDDQRILDEWQYDFTPLFRSLAVSHTRFFGEVTNDKFKDYDGESQIGYIEIETTAEMLAQLSDSLATENIKMEIAQ